MAQCDLLLLAQIVSEVADDLVGLLTVEWPSGAVWAEHGDIHNHCFCWGIHCIANYQSHFAVGGLHVVDDVTELDTRVDLGELLAIDGIDDLTLLDAAAVSTPISTP